MKSGHGICSAVIVLSIGVTGCTGSGTDGQPSPSRTDRMSATPSRSAGQLPWPAAPTTALPSDRATAMMTEMQRWVDQGFLPGVSAAVVSPDGVWAGAVGTDGQGKRLEPTSGMALGQVTQTFVVAEALLLAEQGKLDLDAAASTYLPVPQLANGATTRQLLAHRAAIPDPGNGPYAAIRTAPDERWSTERFLALVAKASTS